ncbi:MAG: tetratricopeptide repeat protein [Candidatus Hodarchaeales archaeon]|jgi:tetratricopeptide (TPR) repeat protein
MLKQLPKELTHARELMDQAKFEEALDIIKNFEKKGTLTQKIALTADIMIGLIYNYKYQWKKAMQIGDRVYKEGREIGDLSLTVDALLLKGALLPIIFSNIYGVSINDVLEYVLEAERKLSEIADDISIDYLRKKASILLYKARFYFFKGIYNKAFECALQCLEIQEKLGRKIDIAYTLQTIAHIYMFIGDHNAGLEYALKSLAIQEELNNLVGIAESLSIVGFAFNFKGNFNQVVEFCEKSLASKEISYATRTNVLRNLGIIYYTNGELNQALKYFSQSVEFAEKENDEISLSLLLGNLGNIYKMKDDDNKAIEYFQRSLAVSEKIQFPFVIGRSFWALISISIDNNLRTQAQQYLERLRELSDQTEGEAVIDYYLDAKAYFLKTSGRTRDRAEAEILWRQIVNDRISHPALYIKSLASLCEFLIEELEMSNDSEILNELNPLIIRWQNIAEKTHSNSRLAWAKLFQAKVALIGMKIEEGKKLMTQAQRIAELHGLARLAQRISYEHDILLEKIDEWENFKKEDAPMAKRIELASIDRVINRLQGKKVVDPPELVDEEPILLLIMDNSGSTYFNHRFIVNWDHSDLFSSFLSAFNTFSSEIFSKSIDRIRIGENTILINPVEPFLACYVIKGQSYPALQKLTRFTETIRKNSEIWQALNKSVETSEILELNNPPELKTVITEIFE